MTTELISTTVVKLTQKIAREFAEMKPSPSERTFRPSRVAYLRARLSESTFHSPRWSFANLNGEPLRGNGQHSSIMLNELSDEEWKMSVNGMQVIIDEFICESVNDLPDLFSQFDPRESVRTRLDLVRAHSGIHSSLDDIKPSHVSYAIAGISFFKNDFFPNGNRGEFRITQNEKAREIQFNVDFVEWASQFYMTQYMRKPGVSAALFATYESDVEKAKEFWDAVVSEKYNPEHPTRILSHYLRDAYHKKMRGGKVIPHTTFYIKSIHAWNSFMYDAKTCTLPRVSKLTKLPTVL